jgi:prepilin-type processing-associated H-X9-DG protein
LLILRQKIGAVDEQWVSSPYRFLRNAHSEGINILYCDGHVGWKRAVIGDDLQAVFRYDAKCSKQDLWGNTYACCDPL